MGRGATKRTLGLSNNYTLHHRGDSIQTSIRNGGNHPRRDRRTISTNRVTARERDERRGPKGRIRHCRRNSNGGVSPRSHPQTKDSCPA
ncbi:hypothetical protein A2U01_0059348 [Trifolium medium]|uniref:Uncharacterized protein n=1 Tax=Trifolium medium TaxID=97028 RepID=A0A392RQR4_9FABA|nr:hypothetical protein [Trifolium medium]